ncbi:MAG TPA: DUF2071 domain-containing protein [Candidatus Methylacidiphilales bacterium]|nr:DUF2071 domain-containing protein [Candidatus Methylacidiphilales bacterium]
MESSAPSFLTAEWRYLAMLNYEIDPVILSPFLPKGTELDQWQEKTFASVVGFLFLKTRIKGVSIPFHSDFEEVNLRFYVRRSGPEGWRRGVVFIKELVPRRAIAWVARTFYNENYLAVPMGHEKWEETGGLKQKIAYTWTFQGRKNCLELFTQGEAVETPENSHEEFIIEHYWGYARQRDGGTAEYRVEHPRWRVWSAGEARLDCDVAALYGPSFVSALSQPPYSAFLADGSAITVFGGVRLPSA